MTFRKTPEEKEQKQQEMLRFETKYEQFLAGKIEEKRQFLKTKYQQEQLEISILSESSLQKDWLQPEEDEAWQNL